jgi:hypothetical protein
MRLQPLSYAAQSLQLVTMAEDQAAVFIGLGAEKHLNRERALRTFQQIIQDTKGTDAALIRPAALTMPPVSPAHQQQGDQLTVVRSPF